MSIHFSKEEDLIALQNVAPEAAKILNRKLKAVYNRKFNLKHKNPEFYNEQVSTINEEKLKFYNETKSNLMFFNEKRNIPNGKMENEFSFDFNGLTIVLSRKPKNIKIDQKIVYFTI